MNKIKIILLQFLVFICFICFTNNMYGQEISETVPTEIHKVSDIVATTHAIDQNNKISPNQVLEKAKNINTFKSENVFVLFSALFVMFMTLPGIGLFYSGLVRKKNVLSLLVQTSFIFIVITLLWFIAGYSLAFSDSGNGFIGSFKKLFLLNIDSESIVKKGEVFLSEYIYVIYNLAFAIITCALIIGSVAERMKIKAIIIFSVLWLFFIYCPLSFILWSGAGWGEKYGVLDWAGGLVVHVNAGVCGLILATFADKRQDFGTPHKPHNLALVFIGTAFLVVGWAGFNGGSSFDSIFIGAKAIVCSFIASAAGGFMWAAMEKYNRGSISLVGVSSGLLVGLISVTPAAGYIEPISAMFFGLIPVPFCISILKLIKNKIKIDDTLDVFAIHGVAGIIGSIMTGYFAKNGQFWSQLYATIAIVAIVATIAYVLITLVYLLCACKIRYENDEEQIGLDLVEHGEELE